MSTRPISALAAVATAALALGTLAGCSIATGGNQTGESTGGKVTVLTHDSFEISEELRKKFEAETGYQLVTTAPGDAGVVASQLKLEGGASGVDAVFGIDNYSALDIAQSDALADYTSPKLPESAKSYDLSEKLTPIDRGQVCVNIDHDWFKEQGKPEPASIEDLAKPEYASLFTLTNPTTSSPGLAFMVATVNRFGEDKWHAYWNDLLEGGAKINDSWSDAYFTDFSGAEGAGKYPLVLSYSSSPAATERTTGVLADSCTEQIEYAGVLKDAANPEGAQAFIDFMLDEQFQQELPEAMYMYPINDDTELPEAWSEKATLVDDPIEVDLEQLNAKRETWLKEWTELYEQQS